MESDYDDTPETAWPEPPPRARKRRRSDGADRHAYQVMRAHFREQCAARKDGCWLCSQPINYALTHPDPWSWTLDHIILVSVDARLEFEPSNWASAHRVCNLRRQKGELDPAMANDGCGIPSEIW